MIALSFTAALLSAVVISPFGPESSSPFGLGALQVIAGVMIVLALLIAVGARSTGDLSAARLAWLVGTLLVMSIVFGIILEYRTDAFFTRESLDQVSAFLLILSLLSGTLERRVAKGTPSDVLASSTAGSAVSALLLFWLLAAVNLQPAAAVFLLLGGILVGLTVLLRIPGAIVPMYRTRRLQWRRRLGHLGHLRHLGRLGRLGRKAPGREGANDSASENANKRNASSGE